jgi:hypothetical protein
MISQKNIYIQAFTKAQVRYNHHENRPGYERTFFSALRHSASTEQDQTIVQFKKDLDNAQSDAQATEIVKARLQTSKWNNHSFNAFFTDELTRLNPSGKWSQFIDKSKQFVWYTGVVYRGTLQKPEDAFKNGMKALEKSKKIDDYADPTTRSIGISTSKVKAIADTYKDDVLPGPSPVSFPGYVYKITCRVPAVDIHETYKLRDDKGAQITTVWKQEVNVIETIPPEDIKEAYFTDHGREVCQTNPNYKDDKPAKDLGDLPLETVFKLTTFN